jgi:hypothetical protein
MAVARRLKELPECALFQRTSGKSILDVASTLNVDAALSSHQCVAQKLIATMEIFARYKLSHRIQPYPMLCNPL